jgi:hypothetical protein
MNGSSSATSRSCRIASQPRFRSRIPGPSVPAPSPPRRWRACYDPAAPWTRHRNASIRTAIPSNWRRLGAAKRR